MNDDAGSVCTERVQSRKRPLEGEVMEMEGPSVLNIEKDLMTAEGFGEAMDLVPSMLAARATRMFTNGDGKPRTSGEDKIATVPTRWLLKLAKDATFELFTHHLDDVQQSWGAPLDKEEALGYLICDALGIEVMPEEARAVGKKSSKLLKAAKGPDDKLKGGAAARRTRARQAADKRAAPAGEIAKELATIDEELNGARAAHWGAKVELPLPRGELVTPKPPDAATAAAQEDRAADAAIAAAKAKLAAVEAVCAQAAHAHSAAKRNLLKLLPPASAGQAGTLSERTQAQSSKLLERLELAREPADNVLGALLEAERSMLELGLALCDAEAAVDAARDAVREAEDGRAELLRVRATAAVAAEAAAEAAEMRRREEEWAKEDEEAWWQRYELEEAARQRAQEEEVVRQRAKDPPVFKLTGMRPEELGLFAETVGSGCWTTESLLKWCRGGGSDDLVELR